MTATALWGPPVLDWQFYAVTALAVAGCWLALRPFFARGGKKAAGGCSSCTFGAAPKGSAEKVVSLGRRSRQ